MMIEWTALATVLSVAFGSVLYVLGGLRFRRWAVEDRPGIPRFPTHIETIFLWLIYSVVISVSIVVVKQTLRHL